MAAKKDQITYILAGVLFIIFGWIFTLSQDLIAENRDAIHKLESSAVTKRDLTGAVKFIRDDIAELRKCCSRRCE